MKETWRNCEKSLRFFFTSTPLSSLPNLFASRLRTRVLISLTPTSNSVSSIFIRRVSILKSIMTTILRSVFRNRSLSNPKPAAFERYYANCPYFSSRTKRNEMKRDASIHRSIFSYFFEFHDCTRLERSP